MPAKLFVSVQFTTKTEPTPNDLLVLDKTRYQRNAVGRKGVRNRYVALGQRVGTKSHFPGG